MNESANVKVLVLEDEQYLLDAYIVKLQNAGFEVLFAHTGREGLEQLKKEPDIILLDYYMPEMNGLEFLHAIRDSNNQVWKDIPVFVVSNTASQKTVQAMLKAGAKRYFVKAEHTLQNVIDEVTKHTSSN